jgi:hypothetical protein
MTYDVFRRSGLGDQDVWKREAQRIEADDEQHAVFLVARTKPSFLARGPWLAVRSDAVKPVACDVETHDQENVVVTAVVG